MCGEMVFADELYMLFDLSHNQSTISSPRALRLSQEGVTGQLEGDRQHRSSSVHKLSCDREQSPALFLTCHN